ncbi:MAG: hypothetical protein OXH83_19605 [Bryobacterales bacterium]|nr:hypothetical protein [Bryobacterales bacterium]
MARKPTGVDQLSEQSRLPVVKSEGVTKSERYLAKLADKSFLNLWSYPSLYRDQKQSGSGDGKELCDLLVVCGPQIIIFSEKTIAWPNGELDVAWKRWVKRAVRDAAKQAKGAERWITEYPERIFLDRGCKTHFPIDFPSPQDRVIHRVVVVKGAAEACRRYLPNSSGSMIIEPAIKADGHWSSESGEIEPFAIGDVDPAGSFVHVIDDVALDIIMRELDTILDFTDYLNKKEVFVRSGRLYRAHGEENLLAYYAVRINDDGVHDFVPNSDGNNPVEIDRFLYPNFRRDARYVARRQADTISYLWDELINKFTTHMLNGTSITPDGYEFDLKKSELGVRYMALEPRFVRRSHGEAVRGALEIGVTRSRFFRTIMSSVEAKPNETAFFIHTFKYLNWMERDGGYKKYRAKRAECTQVYARGLLEAYPHLTRVVGIALEPPEQGRGGSQDLVYAEQCDWTDEDRSAIRQACKEYGVLQSGLKRTPVHVTEWPGA